MPVVTPKPCWRWQIRVLNSKGIAVSYMAKEEALKIEGQVVEALPNAKWRVELPNKSIVIAYLGGKLRKHEINIAVGDRVNMEISMYDLSQGRIVYRN